MFSSPKSQLRNIFNILLIKYKNFKNLLINFSLILLFESINNTFGVLHLVIQSSRLLFFTTQITYLNSINVYKFSFKPAGFMDIPT